MYGRFAAEAGEQQAALVAALRRPPLAVGADQATRLLRQTLPLLLGVTVLESPATSFS
jgi:hypothetical protein